MAQTIHTGQFFFRVHTCTARKPFCKPAQLPAKDQPKKLVNSVQKQITARTFTTPTKNVTNLGDVAQNLEEKTRLKQAQ